MIVASLTNLRGVAVESSLLYVPLLLVPVFIAFVDFFNLLRVKFKKAHRYRTDTFTPEQDFTVLIPIFGSMSYLKNIDYLKRYGRKVVLCTTTKESDEFNRDIKAIARANNFRIFRSSVPMSSGRARPNPWRLFHRTLEATATVSVDTARDEIIRDSFSVVRSKYCIFLDGDTTSEEPLENVVGMFVQKGYDIASVRVLASRQKTLAEKLQSIEYELAMDARRIYPWLTSGACMITKKATIQEVMGHHSLFFQGGDIEVGKLASLLRAKVGHLYTVFYTDVPETLRAWVRQRRSWSAGGFRHAIINIHRFSWRHPFYFFYTTIVVFAFTPVRWYEIVKHPVAVPIVIMIYWILLFTFHWKHRKWYFILFPMYALFQVLVIVPLGTARYFRMAVKTQNIGHIKLRYRQPKPEPVLVTEQSMPRQGYGKAAQIMAD